MARQLSMGQINSISALHQAGRSNRQIAKLLGIHRETVAKHLAAAEVPAKPDPQVLSPRSTKPLEFDGDNDHNQ